MKKYCTVGILTAAIAGLALATPRASAAPFMFATFDEPSASQGFTYTNDGGTSGSMSASTAVEFEFTAPTGLPTTIHNATLTITAPAAFSVPAATLGTFVDQPIPATELLSIIENGTGKNLLTMTFTGDLTGRLAGHNADISGDDTTANVVSYTSDFLSITGPGNSFDLGLATLSNPLAIGPGGFLNSFIANIDGQFTGNNISGGGPGTPEPASLGILALGATALLSRRRNA